MRMYLYVWLGILTGWGLLSSCSNELDVTAEPKDIYVVYGVLDPDKPVQEIRIQKAFLTEGNAIEYGATHDNSLKNATVTLTCDGCTPLTLQALDTVKNEGEFYREHTLYVTRPEDRLIPGNRYTLRVSLPGSPESVLTAVTHVPARPRIFQPDSLQPGLEGDREQHVTASFNGRNFTIRFSPRSLFSNGTIGVAYELRIFLDYASNGVSQPQLRYGPGTPFGLRNGQGEIVLGQAFQSYLTDILRARHLPSDDLTFDDDRFTKSCRIEITALDQELYNYMRVNSPAFVDFNTISPEYTNIQGGYGVLGGICRASRFVKLPECTKYLARLNDTPMPTAECPAR
ncbi:MAG: DUF4249 family protein [Bacteroidetes bacterium]|nr:DUF4249 family protein [Bacteroidota bacterium]